AAAAGLDPVNQQLAADAATYLPHQLLALLDRTTMAVSIEGRVPYLDHRVVELALAIPGRGKYRLPYGNKWLLRQLAAPHPPPTPSAPPPPRCPPGPPPTACPPCANGCSTGPRSSPTSCRPAGCRRCSRTATRCSAPRSPCTRCWCSRPGTGRSSPAHTPPTR